MTGAVSMGYEFHITRREFHADDHGPEISSEEWISVVEMDEELELEPENGPYFAKFLGDCRYGRGMGWFDWAHGCISTKNPDEAILVKMLKLAEALNAKVQGDDGEIYVKPDLDSGFLESKASAPEPNLFDRFRSFCRTMLYPPVNRAELPFKVGDRVRDPWGNEGLVMEIDRRAERGLGKITLQYEDGRILSVAIVAHGIEKVTMIKP